MTLAGPRYRGLRKRDWLAIATTIIIVAISLVSDLITPADSFFYNEFMFARSGAVIVVCAIYVEANLFEHQIVNSLMINHNVSETGQFAFSRLFKRVQLLSEFLGRVHTQFRGWERERIEHMRKTEAEQIEEQEGRVSDTFGRVSLGNAISRSGRHALFAVCSGSIIWAYGDLPLKAIA